MDHGFFRFFTEATRDARRILRNTLFFLRTMTSLPDRVARAIKYLQSVNAGTLAELAATKEALAAALANDAADTETIAAARAAAEAAQAEAAAAVAKVAELQALADADAEKDAAISAILDSVLIPEPEEVIEEPAA